MTTYDSAVAEFRNLDDTIEAQQWRQAQITYEQTRPRGPKTGDQWAQDVGKSPTHIDSLIRVWKDWGAQPAGLRPSFADAYRMAERFTDTPEEASAVKDANRAASALDKVGPIVKAGIIREHLADPEVAREVMSDRSTRARATAAIHKSHDEDERKLTQTRQERVERGERPDFERSIDVTALASDLASVVVRTDRISGMMDRLSDHDRSILVFSARRAQASVDYLAGLEGNASVDDELAELFGEQS